eukprot:g70745.t1
MTRSNTRNKESKAAQAQFMLYLHLCTHYYKCTYVVQELATAKERVAELEADLQVAKAAAEKTALGKSESESNLKEAVDNLELSKAKASQLKAQLKATMQELESVKAQREVLKMRSGIFLYLFAISLLFLVCFARSRLSSSLAVRVFVVACPPHPSATKNTIRKNASTKNESEANHHPATVNITSMRALHTVASAKRRAENIITCKTELQLFYSYNFGSRRFGMKL